MRYLFVVGFLLLLAGTTTDGVTFAPGRHGQAALVAGSNFVSFHAAARCCLGRLCGGGGAAD